MGTQIPITGYFGPQTENAVKAFQAGAHVSETGVCDGNTCRYIRSYLLGMDASVPTSGAYSPASYPAPSRVLEPGLTGDDVKWLQAALRAFGGDLPVTGNYGNRTSESVKAFQGGLGLQQTGKCGAVTCVCMKSFIRGAGLSAESPADPYDPSNFPVPTRLLKLGNSGDDVRWVQAVLRKIGENINVTGYFGENTQSKLRWFQSGYGLPATGECDSTTRAYLITVLGNLPF